jgi:hypothetical protein
MGVEQGGSPSGFGAGATEDTLQDVLTALNSSLTKLDTLITATDTLEGNTDGLEGLLTQIRDYVDTVETILGTISTNIANIDTEVTNTVSPSVQDTATNTQNTVDVLNTIEAETQAIQEVLGGQSDASLDDTVAATLSSRIRYISGKINDVLTAVVDTPEILLNLENLYSSVGAPSSISGDWTEEVTVQGRLRFISEKISEVANSTSDLYTVINGTLIPAISNIEADIEEIRATIPKDLITTTLGGSADGVLLAPTAGSKLRIYSLKFCVDADTFTQVSFNGSGASGTLETYFNPKTGGLYGGSRGQNYTELDVDETLDIDVTGTGTYAVNVRYVEVT